MLPEPKGHERLHLRTQRRGLPGRKRDGLGVRGSVGLPSRTGCCAHSGDGGAVTIATDTCGTYLSKFSGTRCASSCGAGELTVCEVAAECTGGKTCTAVKPKGNDIGVCK